MAIDMDLESGGGCDQHLHGERRWVDRQSDGPRLGGRRRDSFDGGREDPLLLGHAGSFEVHPSQGLKTE